MPLLMCPTQVFLPNNFYLLSVAWNVVILKTVQVRHTVTISGSGDQELTSEHRGHDELIVKFPETLESRLENQVERPVCQLWLLEGRPCLDPRVG